MKINRTLRYGGYATLVIAAVITIVAGINVTLDRFPWRADLTLEHFYSLSDQTQKVLASVRSPISVLELWEAGKEDEKVVELLRKYQAQSGSLQVRQVDPYRSPVELKKYEVAGSAPAAGSVVIDAAGRFKVLRLADMYVMQQDPNTGEQVPTTFIAESVITNAIASVTAASDPVLYFLTGHGEKDLQPRSPTGSRRPSMTCVRSPSPPRRRCRWTRPWSWLSRRSRTSRHARKRRCAPTCAIAEGSSSSCPISAPAPSRCSGTSWRASASPSVPGWS
jgi:hypothetical protein